ncbi:hypothetical protein DPMN_173837 [Dreissena polymorpha]|uniref:Uncharacterized protein n=1 Tax=Dreissena polymorpha TaxID=45954 RepID=A0A9D4E2C2_DREPO|nr:hypothetical protein DPMN_173837 [Dreissena polymorpha]
MAAALKDTIQSNIVVMLQSAILWIVEDVISGLQTNLYKIEDKKAASNEILRKRVHDLELRSYAAEQ